MSLPVRPGMTVPLPGHLHAQADGLRELADLGYTDIWSSEADGADAFTPLALAAAWEPRLRLGTAIVPAFTRAPACLAQSVASLADAAPGRFAIGVGSSSNVIVERWNGVPFVEPYQRVRDVVRFLKDALSGEKVAKRYDSFEISGFKLGVRPEVPPTILVAALREGMLRLAGREADGAIINWLSADDVTRVAGIVNAQGPDKELVARIFVCPSEQTDQVRGGGPLRHRRVPQRPGLRRVPRVARPRSRAAGDVGRVEGRRPQGRAGCHPRRGRRRPHRARLAGAVPGHHPALLRQRRDHVVPGHPPPRPPDRPLGGHPGAVPSRWVTAVASARHRERSSPA